MEFGGCENLGGGDSEAGNDHCESDFGIALQVIEADAAAGLKVIALDQHIMGNKAAGGATEDVPDERLGRGVGIAAAHHRTDDGGAEI